MEWDVVAGNRDQAEWKDCSSSTVWVRLDRLGCLSLLFWDHAVLVLFWGYFDAILGM
jgi:hypothetical protein